MTEKRDPLEQALASLPKDVQPRRDLWAQVQADILASQPAPARPAPHASRWLQLAAGVLLVFASSLVTFFATRHAMQPQLAQVEPLPAPLLQAMPVSFGTEALGTDYLQARGQLDAMFEARLAALPPATRVKLRNDLAELRRAANEIAAELEQHPSDPLLQDLLMFSYQSELQMFANVTEVTSRSLRTDL